MADDARYYVTAGDEKCSTELFVRGNYTCLLLFPLRYIGVTSLAPPKINREHLVQCGVVLVLAVLRSTLHFCDP